MTVNIVDEIAILYGIIMYKKRVFEKILSTGCYSSFLVLFVGFLLVADVFAQNKSSKEKKTKRDYESIRVTAIAPKSKIIVPDYSFEGYVSPTQTSSLSSGVNGYVEWINPKITNGELIRSGEIILRINDAQASLRKSVALSKWEEAKANMEIQEGESYLAKLELELNGGVLPQNGNSSLALRKPQMAIARSREQVAKLNYEQTVHEYNKLKVIAPYDLYSKSINVGLGTYVSASMELLHVMEAGKYYIDVKVLRSQFNKVDFNGEVKIFSDFESNQLNVKLESLSILPFLESESRHVMARLKIISSHQVMSSNLFVNDIVRVRLSGMPINNVVAIPKKALINDTYILTLNKKNKVKMREISVLYSNKENYYTRLNLPDDEKILVDNVKYIKPKGTIKFEVDVLE